jgi:hypothetical protein
MHHNHNRSQYQRDSRNANYTIKTSVLLRVTPVDNYFLSWGILWGCFVAASVMAFWQVLRERKGLTHRTQVDDVEHASAGTRDGEAVSSAEKTRIMVRFHQMRESLQLPPGVLTCAHSFPHFKFRRLLLLAMVARVTMIPVQIWSYPMWCQFVGDTLPEMLFASAWSLLVTFYIQLVGIAIGIGTNTSPGIVIQTTVSSSNRMYRWILFLIASLASRSLFSGLRCLRTVDLSADFRPCCDRLAVRSSLLHLRCPIRNCCLLLSPLAIFATTNFGRTRWIGGSALNLHLSLYWCIWCPDDSIRANGGGTAPRNSLLVEVWVSGIAALFRVADSDPSQSKQVAAVN